MDYNLLNKLTFKTTSYRKNFDLSFKNENFITELEGIINKIKIGEKKLPLLIGEYGISVWNIGLAKSFDIDLIDVLKKHSIENSYQELNNLLYNDKISLDNVNKLIIIQNLIIHPEYRKKQISEEFIEFLYRDYYYGDNNKMIWFVKPIQDNTVDWDYYYNKKIISLKERIDDVSDKKISAYDYYDLKNIVKKDDTEENEYKLFTVASKCGFKRIGESHVFDFKPNNIINRIELKNKEFKETLI